MLGFYSTGTAASGTRGLNSGTTTVSTGLVAGYGIKQFVSASLGASYAVASAVSLVSVDLAASYSIASSKTLVGAELIGAYQIRQAVASVLSAAYGIRVAVSADLAGTYRVRQVVTIELSTAYTVRASIHSDLQAFYSVAQANGQALILLAGEHFTYRANARNRMLQSSIR